MAREFQLLQKIEQQLFSTGEKNISSPLGDDCAILEKDQNNYFVISTDSLVENIHFDLRYFSLFELGKKAMAVNLSDIAAMGAKPDFAFVALAFPENFSEENILEFYSGLQNVASQFDVQISGGDLSKSPRDFFINLTVVGHVQKNQCKKRSAAKPGDGIYVSGHLGSAALGLKILENNKEFGEPFVQALKTPQPQVRLGQILAQDENVHALMDVSDGLLQDLGHIVEKSDVAAEIFLQDLPKDEKFEKTCELFNINSHDLQLAGGEDYQLLFTCEPDGFLSLQKQCAEQNIILTRIGTVLPRDAQQKKVVVKDSLNKNYKIQSYGFDHFK